MRLRSTSFELRCAVSLLVFFLAHLILIGCTNTNKDIPDKDTLVFALEAQPTTLDPRFTTDANGQRLVHLLFNSLVKVGPELKVVADAAESWTYNKLKYKFKLRKGLTFSNDRPLKKEDLLFTFQQYQNEKSPFQTNFKSISKVEVDDLQDSLVITLRLSEFCATLLTDLTLIKILPKQEVESAGTDFAKNPIGTGSFKFLKNEANAIVIEARPSHPIASPKIKRVEFKVVADDNTRYLKLLKGGIDIAQNTIPSSKIKELEGNNEFSVIKYPGPSMNYILINVEDPVFRNLYAREALNLAINRDEIIKYKLDGLATIATSIMNPTNPFFSSELKPENFDSSRARKIIEANKLNDKTILLKTSNTQDVVEIGKVLANQIESIGLKVKLQSYEWGTFFNDIKSGNFQIAMMRWVGAIDPDIYRIAFHSKEHPPGRNRGFYKNLTLDKLLDQGVKIESETARIEHYKQIQEIVFQELPIIPLWYNTQVSVINRRVKGYSPAQNGDFSPLLSVTKD